MMSTNPDNSPAPIVRRPLDVAIPTQSIISNFPQPVPQNGEPTNNEQTNRPTTPVLVTPVNRRSTRELVAIPRVRATARLALSRRRTPARIASVGRTRRAPSNDVVIRTRPRVAAQPDTRKDEKIEKTTTAIEYDPREMEFGQRLAAFPSNPTFAAQSTDSLIIPSLGSVEAKVREVNRLETVALAEKLLTNPAASEKELKEVLKSIFAEIEIMNAELRMIEDAIEKATTDDKKLLEKLGRIEEILKSIDEK